MKGFKNFLGTVPGLILTMLVIAVMVYGILMASAALSIALIVVFIVVALLMDRFGLMSAVFDTFNKYKKLAIIIGIVLAIVLPFALTNNNYVAHIAILAVCYGIACLGLNFQMGSTNMVNFAPAAFMGIGAYCVGVATVRWGVSPWVGMVMGIVITAIFGLLVGLPTLKTKGYYLSLVTMAIQIAFTQLVNTIQYLGAADGLAGVGKYSIFGFQLYKKYEIFGIKMAPQIPYLLLCIVFLVIAVYVSMRIYHGKHGLALNAISQDEIAANCMGVNVSRQKLFAFVVGGVFCGIAGSLLVGLEGHVGTVSYDFSKSLILICMVILGGMDNSIGVIVGAFLLAVMTEKLRVVADFQQLAYGAVLVIMLIVRPNGIIPKRVRDYCGITKRMPKLLQAEAEVVAAEMSEGAPAAAEEEVDGIEKVKFL